MADPERDSALLLLRAMNDLGAKGRTDVNVGLEPEMLERAELPRDSEILAPAMEWLLREGALRPNYAMDAAADRVRRQDVFPEGRRYGIHFNITEHGFALLNIHPNV